MKHFRINSIRPPDAPGTTGRDRRRVALVSALVCAAALVAAVVAIAPPSAAAAAGADGAAVEGVATGAAVDDVQVLLTAPTAPSTGPALFTLPWGDAPGQVGLVRRADEESRGPEALAVAPDGRVAVLDSVNSRLLLLTPTGDMLAAAPLDVAAPRFLAVDDDQVFVLDADDSLRLLTYSWSGAPLADTSVGPFDEPVTALLVDSKGQPLIETNHDRVAAPAAFGRGRNAQPEARGRPANTGAPGSAISARMSPGGRPRIEESDLGKGRRRGWEVALRQGRTIDHLVSLDTDAQGRVVLGLRLMPEQNAAADRAGASGAAADSTAADRTGTGDTASATLLLTRVDEPTQTLLLHEEAGAYLGAPYVVAPSGLIYRPFVGDEGYSIVTYAFPDVPVEVKP